MGADLGALLDDTNAELVLAGGSELLQTDRRGEAGRSGADNDDVIFHPLALNPLLAHRSSAGVSRTDYRGSPQKRECAAAGRC